jgi:hypothetical protein
MDLKVKSNECSALEFLILELNEKVNKEEEDHCVTITKLNRSLKETEDLKCSLESRLDHSSNQNVCIHQFLFYPNSLSSGN